MKVSGCNPRQIRAWVVASAIAASSCGYAEVAQELGPTRKSRIEGPGARLAEGSFGKLRYIVDKDAWYLLADTDTGRALTVFTVLAQRQCEIPGVTSYSLYRRTDTSPPRTIPYLAGVDKNGRGTLRFVNTDCQPYALEVPQADLPLDTDSPRGFAMRSGTGLVFADPVSGTQTTLVQNLAQLERASTPSDKPGWIVRGDSQIVLFDSDWNERGRLGDNPDNLINNTYFTDRAGLQRIDAAAGTATLVRSDVCSVQNRLSDTPATLIYYSPCADRKLVVWEPSTDQTTEPGVTAEPGRARYLAVGSERWLFYLHDVDGSTGLGTLAAWKPDGTQIDIGQRADLDWAAWSEYQAGSPAAPRADLLALLDVANNAGRLVTWSPDGSTRELGVGVWRWARWLPDFFNERSFLTNFDGTALGDVSIACRRGTCATDPPTVSTLAQGVPVPKGGYLVMGDDPSGSGGRPTLLLSAFDGTAGTLLYVASSSGALAPFAPIAQSVPQDRFALMSKNLFPGAIYVAGYDATSKTGRLEYHSFDLDAVGTIAQHVSEFTEVTLPMPGFLYVVPDGDQRGIWYARSK
jgi:hypothetical protein